MRRYLVVANQTLGGDHLLDLVRERADDGTFHLVVPATPPGEHLTWTEGHARAIAQARLTEALEMLRTTGARVDGEVGDAKPMLAILDALQADSYDEIILSTLPPGVSRWLRQDLPHRVQRAFNLPMTHVVAEPERVS